MINKKVAVIGFGSHVGLRLHEEILHIISQKQKMVICCSGTPQHQIGYSHVEEHVNNNSGALLTTKPIVSTFNDYLKINKIDFGENEPIAPTKNYLFKSKSKFHK